MKRSLLLLVVYRQTLSQHLKRGLFQPLQSFLRKNGKQ
nr:MAG TPA: hypothetical protein [Caudoviricetes sp.]